MRFVLAALAVMLFSPNAGAFDAEKAAQEYYSVRGDCRMGETVDGTLFTKDQLKEICAKRDALGAELVSNGYCWYKSEQTWVLCKELNNQ